MNALESAYRLRKARIAMQDDLRRTASYGGQLEPAKDIPDYASPLIVAAQAKCWLAQAKEVSRVRY